LPNIIFDTDGTAGTVTQNDTGVAWAEAGIMFNSTGSCISWSENIQNDIGDELIDWLDEIATGNGADFEIRYTAFSGTVNGLNTITSSYQRLDVNRRIYVSSDGGAFTVNCTIQIRKYNSSDTPEERDIYLRAYVNESSPVGSAPGVF